MNIFNSTSQPECRIRPETDADAPAIDAILHAAFPTADEANLVRRLRANGNAKISLVADRAGTIVGHILFSPVTLEPSHGSATGLGLAPVAVAPAHQNQGIGSALVRAGLDACRAARCPFVVVLGHPGYYPRFGFKRAIDLGLRNEYNADDAFFVVELTPGALPTKRALVKYGPEFAGLG